jgi:hypothetical protein
MGLTWAIPWASIMLLLGMIVDPSHSSYMGWITSGAYPGFVGGVIFSVLLRFAEGHHRFDELSLPRVGAWGGSLAFY